MKTTSAVCAAAVALAVPAAPSGQAADSLHLRAGAEEREQPVLRPGARRLQEGRGGLNGEIECRYIGPAEHGGGEEQMQMVSDLIAKQVDGIAVSPSNAAAMASALTQAKAAGIPVLTWDSDLLPENKDLRIAYVGTHNYDIGVNLAKIVQEIKPNGGTICIQSGGAAAANHNERMQGIRDTLGGHERAPPRPASG